MNIAVGVMVGLATAWLALVVALLLARPRGGLLREAVRLLPDTLRLLKSQNNVLTEEEAHTVSALVQHRGWWLPWMGIPNESSDGISRDIGPEIQRAMILPQGFRQPRHRAVL